MRVEGAITFSDHIIAGIAFIITLVATFIVSSGGVIKLVGFVVGPPVVVIA